MGSNDGGLVTTLTSAVRIGAGQWCEELQTPRMLDEKREQEHGERLRVHMAQGR